MIYFNKRNLVFIVGIIEVMRRYKKPKALAAEPNGKRSINHWPSLSNEIALLILRLLPQKDRVTVSLVNRKFRDLSKDPSLWTQLTLDFENIKQNVESCRKLVDRCKKLASIKITNNSRNSCKLNIMTVVTRAKESLNSLEVDHSLEDWTPAAMKKLGSLKNLTRLSLSFNSDPKSVNSYIGANMLEELANLDQLEVLKLELTHNGSGHIAALKNVFQQLKKLKKVYIYPTQFDESLVVALAENNPDLKVIRRMIYSSLSDRTVDILFNSCPGLEDFIISSSHSENEINKLSSLWPNLKCLEVRGSSALWDDMDADLISKYVEKFRSLERLVLRGNYIHITNSRIERLVGSAENLKHLSLCAPQVTKVFVKRLRIEYPDLDLRINDY